MKPPPEHSMGWRELCAWLAAMRRALTPREDDPDSWAHASQLRAMQAARARERAGH